MKKSLSHDEAAREIWEVYDHQFSWAASHELASYYEDLEDDMGEELEIDPVAIACEWDEYGDAEELIEAYGYRIDADDDTNCLDEDEKLEALLDDLRDNTTIIEFSGGYLVQAF